MSVYLPIYLATYVSRASQLVRQNKKFQAIGQNKTIVALKTSVPHMGQKAS